MTTSDAGKPSACLPADPGDAADALDRASLDRAILDSAVDYAIFTTDLAGRITSWNGGARNLTGWAPQEAIGALAHILYMPEDVRRAVPEHEMRIALDAGRATNERWHVRRDGSRFFGMGLVMPLRAADDRIIGFLKILRDRTAQLHAEQARDRLTHGHSTKVMRLKALADAARSILSASSVSDTLQIIAESARHIVGAHLAASSLAQAVGRHQAVSAVSFSDRYAHWRDHGMPTDGSGLHAWVRQTGAPVRLTQQALVLHPRWRAFGEHAGGQAPLRGLLAVPLVGGDGRNLGLIQLSDKIQGEFDEADEAIVLQLAQMASAAIEQAQTHEALRDSEERFRLVVQSSSLGTYEIDLPADSIHFSPAALEIFDLDVNPAPRPIVRTRIHPDDVDRVFAGLQAAADPSGSGAFHAQYRVRHRTGALRWIDVVGQAQFATRPDGTRYATRLAGVIWDVSEHQQLVQELQLADARKDEFLAMLAHELRNPLAPLTNALAFIERTEPLTERGRGALALAERQRRQLQRLVDDLLEASRVSRGKIELRCEPMTVAAAVYNAAESVNAMIEGRGQDLRVMVPDRPVQIVADPVRVAQVLENLLTNASKYTPEGGSIRVEVQARPDEIEIRVSDDGVGIEPDKIAHLFELFSQLDATIDRAQGGLGIGLALVKRLVELHGGSVAAASAGKGQGATFTVRLPRGGRAGGAS